MYQKFPLRISLYALLIALICMLINPLTTLACGGMFTPDASYTEQSAERLIFTVDSSQVTLYEQIRYTGSPTDFAWVLPVPAVPKVDTAPISLFQELDQRTAPRFAEAPPPSCPGNNYTTSAPAASNPGAVNVYSSGAVGPYSYDVIGSSDPQGLTSWLTGHNYKIPAESHAEMQPYIAAHMLFLALRLRGNAGTNDMQPVKITYATTQRAITIPLRMATPMDKENLSVLVWIFAKSRYVPQNYQSLQPNYDQLQLSNPSAYEDLVSQAVNKVHGHGFVTEYAFPTNDLSPNNPTLTTLTKAYSYLTRMYTSITPAQINLDPSFVAASGLPDVLSEHSITSPANSQPLSCPPSAVTIIAGIIGGSLLVIIVATTTLFVITRRKKTQARPG